MTFVVAALMIVAFAATIAYPFWKYSGDAPAVDRHDSRETLDREKNVALLAIREAELDRAMGKLSDEDYGTLRAQYERRAVTAISALDGLDGPVGATATTATSVSAMGVTAPGNDGGRPGRFCAGCGRSFHSDERFCPACGRARAALA
jgi:rRNA maturation endonuclease Nob1